MRMESQYDPAAVGTIIRAFVGDDELRTAEEVVTQVFNGVVEKLIEEWLDKHAAAVLDSVAPGEIEEEMRNVVVRRFMGCA